MADLYSKKREQLNSNNKICVNEDAGKVIERKRSMSPVARSGGCAGGGASNGEGRKVAYVSDVDKIKADVLAQKDEIMGRITNMFNEMTARVDALKECIDSVGKTVESSRAEILREALNTTIKQQNSNLNQLSDELITHLDKINELSSRVATIEGVL